MIRKKVYPWLFAHQSCSSHILRNPIHSSHPHIMNTKDVEKPLLQAGDCAVYLWATKGSNLVYKLGVGTRPWKTKSLRKGGNWGICMCEAECMAIIYGLMFFVLLYVLTVSILICWHIYIDGSYHIESYIANILAKASLFLGWNDFPKKTWLFAGSNLTRLEISGWYHFISFPKMAPPLVKFVCDCPPRMKVQNKCKRQ